jgi:hypothetical protein
MSNFNPNGAESSTRKGVSEDQMDEYLERLLQKERDKNQAANKEFFENNQALKQLREFEEE